MDKELNGNNFMIKLATFIIDKRKAFYLIFTIAIIYSLACMNLVQVNNDITAYLPASSETRVGLTLMDDEFTTFGTGKVMMANVTYEKALIIKSELELIKGVKQVTFSEEDFKNANACLTVAFDGETTDQISIDAMNKIKQYLKDYDVAVDSEVGVDTAADLQKDMRVILILSAIIIVVVLLFTSKTYMEVLVYLMVFGTAAILNKGTNYWFGEISFVTNSIAVVLQLALAIDYAIIMCHRYMEEHEKYDAREAAIIALSKAIPEISSSSLTTVSGMVALMFMQFRIGMDMGIILTKSIIFSLLTVFLLMPGIIMIFSKGIDKTHHKSFVPKINFVGNFAYRTRYIIPPLFLVIMVAAIFFSNNCAYIYDVDSIQSSKKTETRRQKDLVTNEFGTTNILAVLIPTGDYNKEALLINDLEQLDKVDMIMGLANIEAKDGFQLTDYLTPRQFSELADLDFEVGQLLYAAYAVDQKEYGPIVNNINEYKVPLIDMFIFLYNEKEKGYVDLPDDINEELDEKYQQIQDGKVLLKGENYSRLILNLALPVEGEATFAYLEQIRGICANYYDQSKVYLVGSSTSDKDLQASFSQDNQIITILTALFVMIILLFTFQSAGLPVLLVLAIQGSIWINFSFPYLQGKTLFFLSYLIVSAIQMGATIDYAIVITSRYMVLKKQMPLKEAIIVTLNQAFPTIFTSGTILTCAGFLIGVLSSDPTVASIGVALGRGTLISIIIVLGILPQILLLGDILIQKTAFVLRVDYAKSMPSGKLKVDGHIKGYVEGIVEGNFTGIIKGDVQATIDTKTGKMEMIENKEGENDETK